ncbi:hypothetical protein IW140_001843 [Coemansia sp. RSA 1813]|nr:hypothetical protein EV178_002525 [Coemansia sp. RSA 1646]KAJ1772417.1 hypothetical protein LPJ74_001507 [Coemansia sp. RSA 1843]KAJ2091139.1 hypothetical protein IW138_002101 [Coemansia sp. RSA 986]KAJ2213608.1 hypothetical protein EV179_003724 [Coemansia sp. RSA 487]KAJ2571140.1 hypothetical protein IW140_001843 [Coemansia sp. RSA 1813]
MNAFLSHAQGLPVVTKITTALYFVLSVSAILLRLRAGPTQTNDPISVATEDPARFIILRPGFVINYPWTILTSAFVEPNPLFFVCGLVTLAFIGGFLERQWGPRSYGLFVVVVTAVPALTATLAAIAAYAVSSRSALLYATQVCGLPALVSGFAVGLKQLIPDYNVKILKGALSFRMNDLPGLYTLVVPILYSLLGNLGGVLLVNIGFVEAFIFLRFYKRNSSSPIRGDRSDAFAFITFFPEFAHPLVRRISNGIYGLAVKCKLVTSDEGYQQAVSLESGSFGASQVDTAESPGIEDLEASPEETDADRRRALASKALEMRLGSIPSSEVSVVTPSPQPNDNTTTESK